MASTHLRPLDVLVPVALRMDRPGRGGRDGWGWERLTVDVPDLRSDARCTVVADGFSAYAKKTARRVEGACAGGAHWRALAPGARGAVPTPFEFVPDEGLEYERDKGARPLVLDHARWNGGEGRDRALSPRTASDLRRASGRVAAAHGLTVKNVAAARRVMDAGTFTGSYEGAEEVWSPHPSVRSTPLAPGLTDLARDVVRRNYAFVDGEPMMASPPPRAIVMALHFQEEIRVGVGYDEIVDPPFTGCTVTVPLAAGDELERALTEVVAPGGRFEGYRLNFPANRYAPIVGATVTPDPETGAVLPRSARRAVTEFDQAMRSRIALAMDHGEDGADLLREMVAMADETDGVEGTPRERAAVQLGYLLEFRAGVVGWCHSPAVEHAPDVLDALDPPTP